MTSTNASALDTQVPLKRSRSRLIAVVAVGLIALLGGMFALAAWWMNKVPDDLDYSTTRTTEAGLYQVGYQPDRTPIPVGSLHTWVLTITSSDGMPIEGAAIEIDGDMPQHGHGLPTQPVATQELGGGRYLIEGVKFQMGGWWVVDFEIDAPQGHDKVRFNLILD